MQTKVTWALGPFKVEVTSNQAVELIAGRVKAQADALLNRMPYTQPEDKVHPRATKAALADVLKWLEGVDRPPSVTSMVRECKPRVTSRMVHSWIKAGDLVSCTVGYMSGSKRMAYQGVFVPGTEPTEEQDNLAVLTTIAQSEKVLGYSGLMKALPGNLPKCRAKAAYVRLLESGEIVLKEHTLPSGLEYDGVFLGEGGE